MKGYLTAALISVGLAAMTAAGAATAAHDSLSLTPFYQASATPDGSFRASHSALAELTAPANLFSDLQVDPTALPPLGVSLLSSDTLRSARFALTPTLHFDAAAMPSQVSLVPAYDSPNSFGGDNWNSRSLAAGLNWNFAQWGSVGLTAHRDDYFIISSATPALAAVGRVRSEALGMAAHLGLGSGWVTTAAYSQALTQLDLRSAVPSMPSQSYSFSIAKHGLFGDDAMGLTFSQPAAGAPDHGGLASLVALDNLPPVYAGAAHLGDYKPETDIQLGYVTSYLNGALALQTNASYQMNVQGQSGTNAVTLLSRAKIKF
jgi:hypothetical protein